MIPENTFETKNILDQTYLTLLTYVDSSSSDRFLMHMSSVVGVAERLKSLDELSQVNWMLEYWFDQFASAGLETSRLRTICHEKGICTIVSFNTDFGILVADTSQRHGLPNMSVPLRPVEG